MGIYIILLLLSLIVICFVVAVMCNVLDYPFIDLASPFIAGIIMPVYSLLYAYIYPLFTSLPENPYKYSKYVLWGFSICLVLMIFSDSNTRTTKSGKADKRFKEQYDSESLAVSIWCFFAGLCSLGVYYGITILLERFEIILIP